MGREFFYCARCQTRLNGEDFGTGVAVRVGDKVSCEKCLGEMIAPLSFKEQERILLEAKAARANRREPMVLEYDTDPPKKNVTSSKLRVPAVSRPGGAPVRIQPAAFSSAGAAIFLIGTLVLVATLGVLYFFFGSHEVTDTAPRSPVVATAPEPPAVPVREYRSEGAAPSPREEAAKASLEKARDAAKANAPLEQQIELFSKAARDGENTPVAPYARQELDDARNRMKEAIKTDLATVEQDVRGACQKEEFGKALEILGKAKLKHPWLPWMIEIDGRVRDLNVKDAWNAFMPLRDKALEAKKANNAAEIKAIADRVAKWGLPTFTLELDRALGLPLGAAGTVSPPDAAPLTEEGRGYLKAWDDALAPTVQRDHDSAISALQKAVARAVAPEVKAEAQADLDAVKLAAFAFREAVQVLAQWPRGEKISIEYVDEDGRPVQVSEAVVRSDRGGVELLRGGEPLVVELSEITPRSLGELFKGRAEKKPETDGRAAALLCLLEGDAEGARAVLGAPQDAVPAKYWSRASRVAEARGRAAAEAAKKEGAARKLYFAAERERRQTKTKGAAVEKYRTLLNEFADTAIVNSKRAHISAQREGAKDYVFLAEDLAAGGTFKASSHAKTGACWTSDADSTGYRGRENTIDFSFYALPDTPYRCWVYAGACCQETFVFFMQTTDLVVQHPETKQMLNVDPGAGVSVPVRNSIPFLKARHDMHGGPKEPKRWEWISVPLPKYAAPGIKTVRFLTETKGFSIAHAVVSATRSYPPGEAEMKTFLKAPAEAPVDSAVGPAASAAEPRDPTLVAHWKLDDAGGTALDSSGNDNTGILVGDPARGLGKVGNALLLDGKDRYVKVPPSATLDKVQDGVFTIAAWFRPNSKPAGADASAPDGAYAIFMKGGVEGLRYGGDQKFRMDHASGANAILSVVSAESYAPGAFHHVAAVVSRPEGSMKLYVDGKLDGQAPLPSGAAPHDFGAEPWKIGIAEPGRWAADGAVDDVRVYARALTPNDVRILAGGGSAGPIAISISSPAPGERFESGSAITLSAHVSGGEDRLARVEFYQGSILLGAGAKAPWVFSWKQVPSGVYALSARAVDKTGAVWTSSPVAVRVGNAEIYRAINLGGPAVRIDGLAWEPKNARNLLVKGDAVDGVDAALSPAADAARATMLRSFVRGKDGTSVMLSPVPNGSYQLYLYVIEDGASKTFDIAVKGKVVVSKYASGPAGHWERLGPWFVDVTDGTIEIAARGGEAAFCGLEVWRVTK